jgi:hypothetical protein
MVIAVAPGKGRPALKGDGLSEGLKDLMSGWARPLGGSWNFGAVLRIFSAQCCFHRGLEPFDHWMKNHRRGMGGSWVLSERWCTRRG